MKEKQTFLDFPDRLLGRIAQPLSAWSDSEFESLALELAARQFESVPVYRATCQARGVVPHELTDWKQIPALPTAAFKDYAVSSLPLDERTRVFHSSGTSGALRSRHYHGAKSLRVYEASLLSWFGPNLLPDGQGGSGLGLVVLAPTPQQAPNSSLVHMFETVSRKWPFEFRDFLGSVDEEGAWTLDLPGTVARLEHGARTGTPMLILGTAFSFVHLLEYMEGENRFVQLPDGSRLMETGGYKGRSRAVGKVELHRWIGERLGLTGINVVSEYGMSELCSQAYNHQAGMPEPEAPRCFRLPPWARVRLISPETGCEVEEGAVGLVHVLDLANICSVLAVQTEDLVGGAEAVLNWSAGR